MQEDLGQLSIASLLQGTFAKSVFFLVMMLRVPQGSSFTSDIYLMGTSGELSEKQGTTSSNEEFPAPVLSSLVSEKHC